MILLYDDEVYKIPSVGGEVVLRKDKDVDLLNEFIAVHADNILIISPGFDLDVVKKWIRKIEFVRLGSTERFVTYENEGITGVLHEIKQYCEFNKKFPFINFIDGIQKPSSFEPQAIRNSEIIAMIKLWSREKYKQ